MDARLAEFVGDGESVRVRLFVVAIVVVEPDLGLLGPHVGGPDLGKGFVDSFVADLHGLHSVGGKGYTRADFCEMGSLLIDCYGHSAVVESNGESEARYACGEGGLALASGGRGWLMFTSADDGDLEVFFGRHDGFK
jgi:hypothetical protein